MLSTTVDHVAVAPRLRRRRCCLARAAAPSDAQLHDSNWLQTQLAVALKEEDYSRASLLKASLTQLLGASPPGDWFALGTPAWLADRAGRLGFPLPPEMHRARVRYA